MALQDTLDDSSGLYETFSATISDASSDTLSTVKWDAPIYISATGGTVAVEALNGTDIAYTSEGTVTDETGILECPHISELKLTVSGGDAFVTVSAKRQERGPL